MELAKLRESRLYAAQACNAVRDCPSRDCNAGGNTAAVQREGSAAFAVWRAREDTPWPGRRGVVDDAGFGWPLRFGGFERVTTDSDEQQRVLSEVSHDLANRFHRSYYFLELLGDALDPSSDGAASLLEKLRGTVEELESMTRRALDYMRPMEIRTLRVRLSDLTASMRQHAGMRELELRGENEAGSCEVEVDPARISEALAFLCRAASEGDESKEPMVVELIAGNPVGLRVFRLAGAAEAEPTSLAIALTARIARLHGGALELGTTGGTSLTLRLPLAQGGA